MREKEKRVPRKAASRETKVNILSPPLTLMLSLFFLELYLSVFIYADLDTERILNGLEKCYCRFLAKMEA